MEEEDLIGREQLEGTMLNEGTTRVRMMLVRVVDTMPVQHLDLDLGTIPVLRLGQATTHEGLKVEVREGTRIGPDKDLRIGPEAVDSRIVQVKDSKTGLDNKDSKTDRRADSRTGLEDSRIVRLLRLRIARLGSRAVRLRRAGLRIDRVRRLRTGRLLLVDSKIGLRPLEDSRTGPGRRLRIEHRLLVGSRIVRRRVGGIILPLRMPARPITIGLRRLRRLGRTVAKVGAHKVNETH